MHGSTQPEEAFPSANAADTTAGTGPTSSASAGPAGAVGGRSNGSRGLEETELDSALQLLVERAQYITGATGTALALPQGEEMVCRASAGASAPAVGARLQVRSGLTGESIARRQLLRCDNAESDPRVNLETCRALGIASIVVLPLLRRNGEVRGLFELFSDHPYAFEERDLIALERMADLTSTALDLAEQRQNPVPAPAPRREPERAVESPAATAAATIVPPASSIPLGISAQAPLRDPVRVPLIHQSSLSRRSLNQSSPSRQPFPPSHPKFRRRYQCRRYQRQFQLPFLRLCSGWKNALPADSPFPRGERSASIANRRIPLRRRGRRSEARRRNASQGRTQHRPPRLRWRRNSCRPSFETQRPRENRGWRTTSICWRSPS